MVATKTTRRLTATSRRARPRWRSHQRRARRCRLQRRRLATMRTGANYSLWMVGRQARHGGPTCGAEYILSEARGRGRRRCGVGREEDSDQRCQDRCPAIFISKIFSQKNLAKKLGRVLQPEISGMVCVRVRSCSTPPPFRADEKYPRGVLPEGRISRAAFGARDRSLGRSIGDWLPVSCL